MRSLYQLFLASLVALLLMALAPAPVRAQCRPWQIVDSPNPGVTFNNLLGVAAAAPDDIWAVGFNDRGGPDYPHALHWDGTSWQFVPLPDRGISSIARAVAVLPGGEVWVVGETTLSGGWQRTLIERMECGW